MELKEAVKGFDTFEGTLVNVEDQSLTFQFFAKGAKKKIVTDYDNIEFIRLAVKF